MCLLPDSDPSLLQRAHVGDTTSGGLRCGYKKERPDSSRTRLAVTAGTASCR
jgi:hypothetical protein